VPGHGKGRGDRNPSLSIGDGDGRLLINCHVDCDTGDVFAELRRMGLLDEAPRPRSFHDITLSRLHAARRDAERADEQIRKARWLWSKRWPVDLSDAEWYLIGRGLKKGPWPETIGYLPAHGEHPHCLIAAFGIAAESESGLVMIADDAVVGVHLTKLRPDGRGKLDAAPNKIMVGRPCGSPIVLAHPNDGLGLAVCEGIEDAISTHKATGLGAWAAGSATLMPTLADAVPSYIDCVTVLGHRDPSGMKGAHELAGRLKELGIECAVTFLEERDAT